MARHTAERSNGEAPKPVKKVGKVRVGWKGPSMVRYLNEQRWEKNRARRLKRHLKAHPNDDQARECLAGPHRNGPGYIPNFTPKRMRVPRGTARAKRVSERIVARKLREYEARERQRVELMNESTSNGHAELH